ncbi:MAG: 30S ribosomal protein S16, partial [Bifidobacterium criceti]|nr:30S ribosomal protein S16 [Bifidobacterium criceti]
KITGDWQKFKGLKGAEGTLKAVAAKPDAATLIEEADTKAQKLKAAKAEAALKANEAATDADADAEQKADEKVEFADAEESAPEAV